MSQGHSNHQKARELQEDQQRAAAQVAAHQVRVADHAAIDPQPEPGEYSTQLSQEHQPQHRGQHDRSHASHLGPIGSVGGHQGGEGNADTKPAGNLRQGSHPGARRQP